MRQSASAISPTEIIFATAQESGASAADAAGTIANRKKAPEGNA